LEKETRKQWRKKRKKEGKQTGPADWVGHGWPLRTEHGLHRQKMKKEKKEVVENQRRTQTDHRELKGARLKDVKGRNDTQLQYLAGPQSEVSLEKRVVKKQGGDNVSEREPWEWE